MKNKCLFSLDLMRIIIKRLNLIKIKIENRILITGY